MNHGRNRLYLLCGVVIFHTRMHKKTLYQNGKGLFIRKIMAEGRGFEPPVAG